MLQAIPNQVRLIVSCLVCQCARREESGLSDDRYGQFSGTILHYDHSGHFGRCVTTYKISSYNSKPNALCVCDSSFSTMHIYWTTVCAVWKHINEVIRSYPLTFVGCERVEPDV